MTVTGCVGESFVGVGGGDIDISDKGWLSWLSVSKLDCCVDAPF